MSHLEWDAINSLYAKLPGFTEHDLDQGVHSFNHTVLHSTFSAGCALTSVATLVGVDSRRAGGRLTIRIDTSCARRPIATSYTSVIFRGVDVEGAEVVPDLPVTPEAGGSEPSRVESIDLTALSPYHFTECARDYGAIHTDRAAAEEAGLPLLILHGTGTLAYALSSITNNEAGGDPDRVTGFTGKLTAVVLCPSTVELRTQVDGDIVRFELINGDGDVAIASGAATLGQRDSGDRTRP